MVRVFPVIEAPSREAPFWMPLPPKPWPGFIELSAHISAVDLTLVTLTLASYNATGVLAGSLRALASDFPPVAPGGLGVSDGFTEILPSCCCGLEDWRSWWSLLDGSGSPWLGHDPNPGVEAAGQSFIVWADAPITEVDRNNLARVRIGRSTLIEQLAVVEQALREFAGRLQEFLAPQGIEDARSVRDLFCSTFIDRAAP